MNKINLSELTLEHVGQWPMPVKICTLLSVSLLIIVLGYWLIIQDNFANYARLKVQEVKLKADFEHKQHQVVNLAEYHHQVDILNDRFTSMLKQLPAKNEMPGLLEEISKTGISSGLKFELFAPQPESTHDFYVELPIKISVVGNYFQLAFFLSRVAEINRIVTLHEFSIEEVSIKEHQAVMGNELVMNIIAKIYWYRN